MLFVCHPARGMTFRWLPLFHFLFSCALHIPCWGEEDVDGDHVDAARLGSLLDYLTDFWELIGPGGRLHPAGFIEHRGHLVVEALLVCLIVYLIIQPRSSPSAKETELTDKAGA